MPKNKDESVVVLDIENYKSGKVLSIVTSYRDEFGAIKHHCFMSWNDWIEWLIPLARDDSKFRKLWAHNGGGWDWLSLCEFLMEKFADKVSIDAARANSKLITVFVEIGGVKITLCDSYKLLCSSLEKLSQKFLGYGKTEIAGKLPDEVFKENPTLFWKYAKTDCENLLCIMEKTLKLVRENVAPKLSGLGVTVGSTAMKIYKQQFAKQKMLIPIDAKFKSFCREGYSGGRVEVFQYGEHERIRVYDINSLYPSVMASEKLPFTYRTNATRIIKPKSVGVFRVKFVQKRRDIVPVLCIHGTGVYSGSGVFYTPELHYLRQIDPKAYIEVLEGYEFIDTAVLFADYVDKLYKLRMKDKDGPIGYLCKLFLNSLYGKFAEKSERERIVKFADKESVLEAERIHREYCVEKGERFCNEHGLNSAVSNLEPIDEEKLRYYQKTISNCQHEFSAISGLITSASRVSLLRYVNAISTSNLVYCDTDSIHVGGNGDGFSVGNELGKLKLEFQGSGIYCGRKLYGLRSFDGKDEKIRAKGVTIGGVNGCVFGYDHLRKIIQGEKIECNFFSPTTAIEIFNGKPLCFQNKRKRTLRKT